MVSLDDAYKEYSKLLDTKSVSKDDIYTELMKKEDKVLNVMKRISESENSKASDDMLFYKRPLVDVIATFIKTWRTVFHELVVDDGWKALDKVFWNDDRKIYVGMMFILVALVLFFVDTSYIPGVGKSLQKVMRAKDIAFIFVIGTICMLILISKFSLLSLTLVCVICGSAYVYKIHQQALSALELGNIVQINDPSIQQIRNVLDTYSDFDKSLYEKQIAMVDKLFDTYTDLLMNVPRNDLELLQKYDIFLDCRNTLVSDSYEWILKDHSIPPDLDEQLSKPLMAISSKYMNILENKYPILIRHPRSIYGN